MKLIPPDASIVAPEKKAVDCEEKAKKEAEPPTDETQRGSTPLPEEWVTAVSPGKWHA